MNAVTRALVQCFHHGALKSLQTFRLPPHYYDGACKALLCEHLFGADVQRDLPLSDGLPLLPGTHWDLVDSALPDGLVGLKRQLDPDGCLVSEDAAGRLEQGLVVFDDVGVAPHAHLYPYITASVSVVRPTAG